ncbi:hypothetical protein V8C35DRAFT_267789 [Trichoderma chlorosporum]
MVSLKEVQASNSLINDATAPRVSVFVGGSSGIGKSTIRALVSTGASVKIYLVGRKSAEGSVRAFIKEQNAINPRADIVWTEGEVSLLAEVQRICEIIKAAESRVDLLFLSTGYAPFGTREETSEGIEIAQSLEYYSRMLFMLRLLPLLSASEAPRVISILAGGQERDSINVDDLDLKKPGNFSGIAAQLQYGAMNTAFMEKLAAQNPNVTFIHSSPGWVLTGNMRRGWDAGSILALVFWFILEPIFYLFGFTEEESGQRFLFQSTSAAFGGRGITWGGKPGVNSLGKSEDGLFLVKHNCDSTLNEKVLPSIRKNAQEQVWHHTHKLLQFYL